ALLAAQNIMHRYTVNPDRVYVAGFSGGSRVAMRLALGYPDLFRGALLNAGSDPIGDALAPIHPRILFSAFRPRRAWSMSPAMATTVIASWTWTACNRRSNGAFSMCTTWSRRGPAMTWSTQWRCPEGWT